MFRAGGGRGRMTRRRPEGGAARLSRPLTLVCCGSVGGLGCGRSAGRARAAEPWTAPKPHPAAARPLTRPDDAITRIWPLPVLQRSRESQLHSCLRRRSRILVCGRPASAGEDVGDDQTRSCRKPANDSACPCVSNSRSSKRYFGLLTGWRMASCGPRLPRGPARSCRMPSATGRSRGSRARCEAWPWVSPLCCRCCFSPVTLGGRPGRFLSRIPGGHRTAATGARRRTLR